MPIPTPQSASLAEFLASAHFRRQVKFYLGEASITLLEKFINGYRSCLRLKSLPEEVDFDWNEFHLFVAVAYAEAGVITGWRIILLTYCRGDERLAFEVFLEAFDRYRALRINNNGEWVSDKEEIICNGQHGPEQ